MKTLAASLSLLTLVTCSFATDFKFPDDNPRCTFTIPDSWKPTAYSDPVEGVSAETDDGGLFLCIEALDTKSEDEVMDKAMKWFKDKGVDLDASTMKVNDKFTVNGMAGTLYCWTGKDKDGPCMLQLAVLPTGGGKEISVDYWASPDADKKYTSDVQAILESIKPVAAAASTAK